MKKVFYTALLVVGLITTASAQDSTPSSASKVTRLMVEVNEYLELSASEKENLQKLFKLKYDYLATYTTQEEKDSFLRGFKEKLNSALDHQQMAKLAKNKALYTRLLSE